MTKHDDTIKPYFLGALMIVMLVLACLIFAPFLKTLALAMVFAVVLHRFYKKLVMLLRGWESTAAMMTVMVSVVVIVLPLAFIGMLVANQAQALYSSLYNAGGHTFISDIFARLNGTFTGVDPHLNLFSYSIPIDIGGYTQSVLQWITAHAPDVFSSLTSFWLALFVFLVALYYLLRDGVRARDALAELTPFSASENKKIFDHLETAVNSVMKGSVVIALVQGALTAVGFMLVGLPNGILWGTVAAISSLVPVLGSGLVAIPAIVYLVFIGQIPQAIVLFIWSMFVIGLVDNFLRPKLLGRGMQLHPLLALLAVVGGVIFFGPVGVFLGPLSISLLFALISIYSDVARKE